MTLAPKGSLTVVGTGIKLVGHMTKEAQAFIEKADKVFYVVNEPITAYWIQKLNKTAESLHDTYAEGKLRLHTYHDMAERVLTAVRQNQRVCAVFYGHPGVFVTPMHDAIRQARHEGYTATMLPGISAEDCLYADLGIDPAQNGCQSYEATEFLLRGRQPDTTTPLILWQIGVVGILYLAGDLNKNLHILTDVLTKSYGPNHEVTIYEAAQYPAFHPIIEKRPLSQLPQARINAKSTLYIPAKELPTWDKVMAQRLGIALSDLKKAKSPRAD